MHYYTHNIGDYRRDTNHLSLLEHGIYRQLLDQYYLNEKPIAKDLDKIMRYLSIKTEEEKDALTHVLQDFFNETKDGYVHKRCEIAIQEYQDKSEKLSNAAKARWSKISKCNANAVTTNNHKPITINQEPKTKKPILDGMYIKREGTNMVDLNPDYPHHKDVFSFMHLFWKKYPRKVGKTTALKAWMKKLPDINAVMKALDWQIDSSQWKKGFIPNPVTYINQERWLDEPEEINF